jgi:hypothetical protein
MTTALAVVLALILAIVLPPTQALAQATTSSLFAPTRSAPELKAATESLSAGRVCIKSFPYPPGKFFGSGGGKQALSGEELSQVRKDIEMAIATSGGGKDVPQDAIKRINKIGTLSKLSTLDQTYYLLNKQGIDPDQLKAYASFLELLKRSREGADLKIIEEVERLERLPGWRVRPDPFSAPVATSDGTLQSIERDATYYSTQQLRNAIGLLKVVAKTRVSSSEKQTSLVELISFLENRSSFEPFFKTVGDPSNELFSRVAWIASLTKGQPFWKQREAIAAYPGLRGILRTTSETVAYIGRDKVFAVAFGAAKPPRLIHSDAAAAAYESMLKSQTAALTRNGVAVVSVVSDGARYELRTGNAVAFLSESERQSLQAGKRLAADHQVSKFVDQFSGKSVAFFSHPLMQADGAQLDASKKVLFSLKAAYPDKPIHLDPFSASTYANIKRINEFTVSDPKRILVVVPAEDSGVTDYKIIQNIASDLVAANVEVVRFDARAPKRYAGPSDRAVIVITGHSDTALAEWVRRLGEAGYFKNNLVVFNSCETPLTNQLIFEITTRFGAVGSYTFEGKILASNVEDFVADLVGVFKRVGSSTQGAISRLSEWLTRVGQSKGLRAGWVVSQNTGNLMTKEV